jgi:hypothetical protein
MMDSVSERSEAARIDGGGGGNIINQEYCSLTGDTGGMLGIG